MGGRHRLRPRGRRVRRLLTATVPVIGAAGLTVAVVLGGGAVAGPRLDSARPVAPAAAAPVPAGAAATTVPAWMRATAAPGPLDGVAGDAASAARERREQRARDERERAAAQQARSAGGTCDLQGPPRFDDPAHPNEITNRDCGYVDGRGRERSHDPWIDGQLLSSYGE